MDRGNMKVNAYHKQKVSKNLCPVVCENFVESWVVGGNFCATGPFSCPVRPSFVRLGISERHSRCHFFGRKGDEEVTASNTLDEERRRRGPKHTIQKIIPTNTMKHEAAVDNATESILNLVQQFYKEHPEIKISHGMDHVERVFDHACRAVEVHQPPLSPLQGMEIKVAALLHDVDDGKYFPRHGDYENARSILRQCADTISSSSVDTILSMIGWVSCSKNGNHVPESIQQSGDYHLLIPRWADRLEAVG